MNDYHWMKPVEYCRQFKDTGKTYRFVVSFWN